MHSFCLDMGGTGTRAALFAPDGTEIARTATGPGAISLGTDTTEAAVRACWDVLGPGHDPVHVSLAIGLAGIGLRDRVAALDARLSGFARTAIVGDGYGALLAATGGASGALIAIGTGVAAMRLMPDGQFRTLSGWGFPAGDLGSGAWIGLQAVSALTRHIDAAPCDPPMTPALATTLVQALGGTAAAIMDRTAGRPARDFAALAPHVLAAAPTDPAAAAILARAAAEIAAIGAALHDGAPGDVHLSGGLAPALAPLIRATDPARVWHVTPADPLAGLSLLARGLAPPERLLPRPGLPAPDY
jgi:glucosamine kinase